MGIALLLLSCVMLLVGVVRMPAAWLDGPLPRHLPLRGRWLRFFLVCLLVSVGSAASFLLILSVTPVSALIGRYAVGIEAERVPLADHCLVPRLDFVVAGNSTAGCVDEQGRHFRMPLIGRGWHFA